MMGSQDFILLLCLINYTGIMARKSGLLANGEGERVFTLKS